MMKIAGIVAEYNPFHKGHAHHIDRTRAPGGGCEATHVVAVMSGCFVQRGEPALLPKSDRVRMALTGGADLLLELPAPWCLSSAESFAFGAVSLLEALGCVEVLSFGSESGDTAALEKAADVLETTRFSQLLRYHLEGGIPFPEARQKAVVEIAGPTTASLFEKANNTLGIEYIKALRRLHSGMGVFTVKRFGAAHDSLAPIGDMASASYLRTLIRSGHLLNAAPYLPAASMAILGEAAEAGRCPASPERLERALLARFRSMSKEEWSALPGLSEGLENRLYAAVQQAGSWEELIAAVKTRRYPLTRLQRLLWAAFLGIPAGYEGQRPPYLRILGMNDRGREILAAAKNASLPLVSRASRFETLNEDARTVWRLENRAADLYALALPLPLPCGSECTTGIVRG